MQVFVEAMKNLQKLIGAKRTDSAGVEQPPDKAQVKLCKEKFEVSQKIMEQTIKQIKKDNIEVFRNGDQAAMAMVNEQAIIKEEYTKRINKEKERVSQHKKQISELEANLMMEREQLILTVMDIQIIWTCVLPKQKLSMELMTKMVVLMMLLL